jgi:hypothetical protein
MELQALNVYHILSRFNLSITLHLLLAMRTRMSGKRWFPAKIQALETITRYRRFEVG